MRAIRAGLVIVDPAEPPIVDGVVVVGDDGRVHAAGRRDEVDVPRGVDVEEFPGTALPGLIDMHAHVQKIGADEPLGDGSTRSLTALAIRGVSNLGAAVRAGVTTVRDLGAPSDGIFTLARAVADGLIPGPRIVSSGRALAMTGGHGWGRSVLEVDGEDGFRHAARRQMKDGAAWVKVMTTGGAGTAGEDVDEVQLTVAEMRAAADEAHKRHRLVAAHATGSAGVLAALEAGADTIEHGVLMDESTVAAIASAGAFYCPTLEIYDRIARLDSDSGYPRYVIEKAQAVVGAHRESFRLAMRANLRIIAGTDAGGPTWALGDVAEELMRMVDCGMSPPAAIATATSTAADCLGSSSGVGRLLPGNAADVLVVDGDPTQDIACLTRVRAVYAAGRRIV